MENQNQYPGPQPPNQQPPSNPQGQRPAKPDNYLEWAILSTLLCCLPLGVVSIVYASRVDNLYHSGDYAGAEEASRKAKEFAKWSAISSIVVAIVCLLGAVFSAVIGIAESQ